MLSRTKVEEIMNGLKAKGKNFSEESGEEMLMLLNRASEIQTGYDTPHGKWTAWQDWEKRLEKFVAKISEEMKEKKS